MEVALLLEIVQLLGKAFFLGHDLGLAAVMLQLRVDLVFEQNKETGVDQDHVGLDLVEVRSDERVFAEVETDDYPVQEALVQDQLVRDVVQTHP